MPIFFNSIFVLFPFSYFVHFSIGAMAQDVDLRTQADVDAFDPSTTVIDGRLLLGEQGANTSDITQISNLSNLISIADELIISRNVNLINL